MPQIYSRPLNIFSMIQKPYGGYKIGKVLEVFFFKFEILMHIGFLYNFFTIPKCSYNCLLKYICDFQKNNFFTIPNVFTLLYKYENKAVYQQILYLVFFFIFCLQAVYPFSSTVKCNHEVNRRHQLKMVNCLQQQIFEPTAYNGSVYASYMTNIRYF